MRSKDDLQPFLDKKPLFLFGKQMRKLPMSDAEKEILSDLKELGHLPILPALLQLQPSYEGHSDKDYTPVEALHVIRAGILKDWIFIVIVILQLLKNKYPGRFGNCLNILDEKITNFPTSQSLPFHFRKFSNGKH